VCGVDKSDNELITLEVSSFSLFFAAHFLTRLRSFTSSLRLSTDTLAMYSASNVLFYFTICNSPQVCELDLIFNFHKAYYILDEVLLCGEQQETSKKIVLRVIAAQV
jgi:hypothetical protein